MEWKETAQVAMETAPASTTRTVLELIEGFVRENAALSAVGILTTLVVPIQDVLLPHLTGRVVNAIRAQKKAGGRGAVTAAFLAVGIAVAAIQVAFVGMDFVDAKLVPALQTHVRRRMLACVLDANDTKQAGELETGDLIAKFVKVPLAVSNWFETLKAMVPNALVYVAATVYFAWIDLRLGAGMALAVLVTFASMWFNLRRCGAVSTRRDAAMNDLQERIDEVLHNLPAVFAGNQKLQERAAVWPLEERFERLYYETMVCSTHVKLWMVPAAVGIVGFVLWRCHALLRSGRIDIGQLVSIFAVVLYMMVSMMRLVQHSRTLVFYWGIIQASLDALTCEPFRKSLIKSPEGRPEGPEGRPDGMPEGPSRSPSGPPPILEFEHVSYSHAGAPRPVFADLSLAIAPGERLAVVGEMGSGKSTLVRLLLFLAEPSEGRLLLHGRPYADLGAERVRAAFGYVPQSAPLFDRSILENVRYGLPPDRPRPTEADAWAAARELGVDGILSSLPRGLATPVGKAGSRISGGQRQAVWLVRMLLLDPEIVVLDEPTSAMDPDSRAAVAAAIARLRSTVVFVTHDPKLVAAAATKTFDLNLFSAAATVGG
jgi:ABC-type multidrug transport system fused ATPase/permease subunit